MREAAIYAGVFAAALLIFLVAPQLDLVTSELFYTPGRGFLQGGREPAVLLYRAIPWIAWGVAGIVVVAGIWLFLVGRPWWRLDAKALFFLAATFAVGPGLLANTLLKDHWGRARPAQIEAFGGARQFTAAPLPAAECRSNCSFVSGHAALGFSLVAFAFLLPPGPRRRAGIAAALGFGALVGLARIAQGAHFLSDVVFAGLLAYGVAALGRSWIIDRDGLAAPALRRFCRKAGCAALLAWASARRMNVVGANRAALATIAAVALVLLCLALIDRPLALFFHARGPDLHALFDLTGRLGVAWGWLILFGLVFAALHWGGECPRLRPLARPMRALSALPAFLFAAIAASGLAVNVLKIICGRLRPKLLFSSGLYGFDWFGWHADYWSFPSGHTATIVALVTALWVLWPRHLLFYILTAAIVAGSRVVVGAHYLSDVVGGAVLAVAVTRGMAWLFARGGIDLVSRIDWGNGRETARREAPWPCRCLGSLPVPRLWAVGLRRRRGV